MSTTVKTSSGWRMPILAAAILSLAAPAAMADRGKPNFSPAIWADGQLFGTKGTTSLPAPNAHNEHSYDVLMIIINSNNPLGQLPVAEAAPGNPAFNGGRWIAFTAWWTESGIDDHETVPVITSYEEFLVHYMLGHLEFELGHPAGGDTYFQCPLLPVKQ
jgi:hypothetical protein